MERPLESATLAHGARIELSVLETPASERAAELGAFYMHKGEDWRHHIDSALARPLDALETRFTLARIGGALVSAITTITAGGVGYVGHVYTEVAHRGRGICSFLFPAMMAAEQERGARALYLTTGYATTPYRIYQRSGFAGRYPESGEMEWFAESENAFNAAYFAPGACRIEPVRWEHWPLLNPLTARKGEKVVSWGLNDGIFGPAHFEHWFLILKKRLDSCPGAAGRVLVSEHGSVVGLATLLPRWGADSPRVLDFLTHPAFAGQAPALIDSLPACDQPTLAYAADDDDERIALLESAGFHIVARAAARCPWTGDVPADRIMFQR